MENQNQETVNQNQEAQAQTQEQPQGVTIPLQQGQEVEVIELSPWMSKAWRITKKALKIAIPFATAVVGAIFGVKYGSDKTAKSMQPRINGLTGEVNDLRMQLEACSAVPMVPEIPEVPDVVPDVIPVDIVE